MEKQNEHQEGGGQVERSLQPYKIPKRKRSNSSLFDMQLLNQGIDLSMKESSPKDVEMELADSTPPKKKIFVGLPTSGRSGFQGYSGASSIPSVVSPPSITTRPSRSTDFCPFSQTAMWQYMNLPHTVTSKTKEIFSQELDAPVPSSSTFKAPQIPPLRRKKSKSSSKSMPPPPPPESMDWQPSESSARTSNTQHIPKRKSKKKVSWCDEMQFSEAKGFGSTENLASWQRDLEQAGPSHSSVPMHYKTHSQ